MLWTICIILLVLWALGMLIGLHRLRADPYPAGSGGSHPVSTPRSGAQNHELVRGLRDAHGPRGELSNMPLINIVLALIVVGVVLWLINTLIPMASSIKTILNVVVVVSVAIWVLQAVGLWGRITSYKFT